MYSLDFPRGSSLSSLGTGWAHARPGRGGGIEDERICLVLSNRCSERDQGEQTSQPMALLLAKRMKCRAPIKRPVVRNHANAVEGGGDLV
jgi:hypothetical protein